MIDMDSLLRGTDYSELKESYVIFICLDDPFDADLPVYTFERTCRESGGVDLGDKTHHLIFNAAAYKKEKDSEIRDFLAFVKNNKPESDFTRGIESMVQAKKFENTFLNEYLAISLHERDVKERATRAGMEEGKIAMCLDLVNSGLLSIKDAALKLGITEDDLREKMGQPG